MTKRILVILFTMILLITVTSASPSEQYIPSPALTEEPYGMLYGHVLCMHNLFSKEMVLTIQNFAENSSIMVGPDGKFNSPLNPGHYQITLIDGNAGHTETKEFDIVAGKITYIWFIGHAISVEEMKPVVTPTPTPTITTVPTIVPTIIPTTIPTATPTPVPTVTTVPTTMPTVVPTITPVPTPMHCHTETVMICGNWWRFCWDDFCIPNHKHCEWVTRCIE